jgi:proteasome accessory factor B
VVLVRAGAGHTLRRRAAAVEAGVPGPDGGTWDRLRLIEPPFDLAGEILAHGPDVYVEEPATLRQQVIDRLQGVLA